MAVSGSADHPAARRLAGSAGTLLDRYDSALLDSQSTALADAGIRRACLRSAATILEEVCAALSGASAIPDPAFGRAGAPSAGGRIGAGPSGGESAAAAVGTGHPTELFRAAMLLFEILLPAIAIAVAPEDDALAMMTIGVRAAHVAIMSRMHVAVSVHSSTLLSKVHDAHVDERARIARELHDRLGSSVSAAVRCVESLRVHRKRDPAMMDKRIVQAEESLREAVDEVRRVARGLRLSAEPRTLRNALLYAARSSAPVCTKTVVDVVGDEAWAPPATLDELFLVLREAMRNAYTHAEAETVTVHVEIAPHEVRASVVDDGVGVDPMGRGDGLGLVSMRERMVLVGGTVSLLSTRGAGTSVEVRIPLSGAQHVA